MENKGRLIISGFGKRSPQLILHWLLMLLTGAVIIPLAAYAHVYIFSSFSFANIIFPIICIAGALACLIDGLMIHKKINQLKIDVYDNGITGVSVGTNVVNGIYKTREFDFTYDKVKSVKKIINGIVINTSDRKHRIYTSYSKSIIDIIEGKMAQNG